MTLQIWRNYSPNRKTPHNNHTRGFFHDMFKQTHLYFMDESKQEQRNQWYQYCSIKCTDYACMEKILYVAMCVFKVTEQWPMPLLGARTAESLCPPLEASLTSRSLLVAWEEKGEEEEETRTQKARGTRQVYHSQHQLFIPTELCSKLCCTLHSGLISCGFHF